MDLITQFSGGVIITCEESEQMMPASIAASRGVPPPLSSLPSALHLSSTSLTQAMTSLRSDSSADQMPMVGANSLVHTLSLFSMPSVIGSSPGLWSPMSAAASAENSPSGSPIPSSPISSAAAAGAPSVVEVSPEIEVDTTPSGTRQSRRECEKEQTDE